MWGRSGSSLLHSLLYDHPQVLSIPIESLIVFFRRYPSLLRASVINSQFEPVKFIECLSAEFPNIFAADPRFPHHGKRYNGGKGAPLEGFASAFLIAIQSAMLADPEKTQTSIGRSVFYSIFIAYAHALGREIGTREPIIVWQQHDPPDETERQMLMQYLPNIKFLHSVRLPEKAFDSNIFHMYRELPVHKDLRYNIYVSLITTMLERDKFIPQQDSMRFFCVRMEDLHTKTRETMELVARWVNIDWDDTLLKSTHDGEEFKLWRPGGYTTGLNPQIWKQNRCKCLFFYDRWKLRYLFEQNYKEWGYNPGLLYKLLKNRLIRKLVFALPSKVELMIGWEMFKELYDAFYARFLNDRSRVMACHSLRERPDYQITPLLESNVEFEIRSEKSADDPQLDPTVSKIENYVSP